MVALPFSRVAVSLPRYRQGYPRNPRTVGEHIKKRRMDLSLLQKDVANIIGVSEDCITYWENARSTPQIQFMPRIVKFLDYNPVDADMKTLAGQIRNYRILNGLSHKKFGEMLGVDATTVGAWELGTSIPKKSTLERIRKYIKD